MCGQKENQHAFLEQSQLEFHKTVHDLVWETSVKWRPPDKKLQLNAWQEIVQDSQRTLSWAILYLANFLQKTGHPNRSDIQSGMTNWTD